jgi:iron complex outermembrane receptor protein
VIGRVTDATTQQPLSGVTVLVGEHGALTDANGRYSVGAVSAGTHSLRAVLLGYKDYTQEVTVTAGQTLTVDVSLAQQAVQLAQLVVVGYGTQRASNITGAVKQVSPDQFNTGRIVAPEELITSKVAGVQVVDNNEPGGGISVRIRGATSINASSDPLYVVDGVPLGSGAGAGLSAGRNPLNFLNPQDIESITVLKDAASAAIYGANAANGVVLITTKNGRRGPQMEYTGSVSGSVITRLPDMLNADQFRKAVTDYASKNVPQLKNANTDWFGQIDRKALGQDHNLALSSVGANSDYRLSLGYLDQDGVIAGTTTQRLSASLNYSQRMFDDHLTVRTNLKGAREYDLFTPGGVLSNAAQMGPTQPILDPTATSGYYNWPGGLTSPDNPVEILKYASDKGTTYRSIGNMQADYRFPFLEALKATVNLGYDVAKATRQTFTPGLIHSQTKTANGGTEYRRDDTQANTVLESYLNYAAPLQHVPGNIDLTGGYSYNFSHGDYPWYQLTGLSTDLLGSNGLPGAKTVQNGLSVQENKLISFFGRANYSLKDRYIIGASIRRDGSSRFGPSNAWGTFPSVSAAWRISDESFLKGNSMISDLKLRGSWGKTGNQAFANYQQYSTYQVGDAQSQVWFGNEWVTTIRPSAADQNIKWEETSAYNVGFDYGFFNNKFTGAIDAYSKKTNDLIFTVPIPAGTNLSNFLTTNIGSMKNSGIEASLSTKLVDGGKSGFNWTTDFNAAHNTNELTAINPNAGGSQFVLTGIVAGGVGTFAQVLTPGSPINSFYVYQHKMEGGKPLFKDVQGSDANGKFTNAPDGQVNEQDLYVDINKDGKIDGGDRRPFHSPAPKWIFGHSSYMTYNKLDASFTLRAYLGNYVYNNVASNLGTYQEVGRGSPYNLNASVLKTGFTTPQYLSDYYVEDASFLRMDNVTVGYNVKYHNQPMRLFASVQNVFTLTGYSGVDPTAGLNGIDNNIYPRSRTFAGGLNVRF